MHADTLIRNNPDSVLRGKSGLFRPIEVIVSLAGLLLFSPFIGLAALAIVLASGRPILFRQERVGRNGRIFTLYKLRTMRLSRQGPQVTAGDDARVTLVGRLLRKTKLDELPELWNVVKGDMSLVGPRPEVPRYVDLQNPAWQLVLAARPGITDPITLRLRNEESLLAQVEGDRERFYLETLQPYKLQGYLEYLKRRSWRSDAKVLLATPFAILFPGNAPPPTAKELLDLKGFDATGS